MKNLHNTNIEDVKKTTTDLKVTGDGNLFTLLSKASSESQGWMKSTKAMFTGNGCVVQVTTEITNQDGTKSIAEALTFVPGVMVGEQWTDSDCTNSNNGKCLVPIKI